MLFLIIEFFFIKFTTLILILIIKRGKLNLILINYNSKNKLSFNIEYN